MTARSARAGFLVMLVAGWALAACQPKAVPVGKPAGASKGAVASAPAFPPPAVPTKPPTWLERAAIELGAGVELVVFCEPDGAVLADAATGKRVRVNALKSTECFLAGVTGALYLAVPGAAADTFDLYVQDLRSSEAPALLVSAVPVHPCVAYGDRSYACDVRYGGDCKLVVASDGKVSLQPPEGLFCDISGQEVCDGYRTTIKGLAVQRADLLATLAARAAKEPDPVPPKSEGLTSPIAVPAGDCENSGVCGSVEALTAGGLVRIAVSQSCGDACYVAWAYYDSAQHQFLNPQSPGERAPKLRKEWTDSSPLTVASSGKYVERGACVHAWDGSTKTCGAVFGGFVRGDWDLE